MRTKLFLSLALGLLISVGISAKDPVTTTFSNMEMTADGSIKEFTTFTADTNEPMQRSVYKYDLSGNILEKIVYSWAGSKGWIGLQKLEYAYASTTNTDKPTSLTYTRWDKKANNWSKASKVVTYDHNDNGTTAITTDKN